MKSSNINILLLLLLLPQHEISPKFLYVIDFLDFVPPSHNYAASIIRHFWCRLFCSVFVYVMFCFVLQYKLQQGAHEWQQNLEGLLLISP